MMKKFLLRVVLVLLACGLCTTPAFADIGLFDWAANIDGIMSVPPAMDVSLFDDVTGLGTITVTVGGPGAHFVGLFLDHEIDETTSTFSNEIGATSGAPAAGQSWEIDEPGWVNGNIYENLQLSDVSGSFLDNRIGISIYGDTTFPDDVSMAMGWNFNVAAQPAVITFSLSDVAPSGGFYLIHSDPSGESVYFSSDLTFVPLPGAVLMGVLGLGTAGGLLGRFQRRRTQK